MGLRRGERKAWLWLLCASLFIVAARTSPTSLHTPLDPPLCPAHSCPAAPAQPPTHTTLGFITNPNSTEWVTNYCWSRLTHVAWCHLELAATGDLTPAWEPGYWSSVPQLVDHIHQTPWTRFLLTVSISGHQYSPAENKTKILLDRSRWPTFFEALVQRIHEADADGVMFDIEHIDHVPGGLAAYGALVLQTAAHLRKQPREPGRPTLQTMLCTVQYPRVLSMNYTALANGLDALFLMDYNDHGVGSPYAGPVTQLHSTAAKHPPPMCEKNAGYGNLPGIDGLLGQWTALGVLPSKMLLGLPWFGGEWPVARGAGSSGAPIKGAQPVGVGMADCGGAGCGWNSLYKHQLADLATEQHWDECMEQPWYNRQNSTGGWVQGWFDNRISLVRKYERAKQAGLQGVGIWLLGYGTLPLGAPLWHSLADSFSACPRNLAHKTDDIVVRTSIHGDGSKLPVDSTPPFISCKQAGIVCSVGGGALADSELGLTEVVHIGPERRKIFIGSPSIWKLPNGTVLASHDYFTNCKSYPMCWQDASQHNSSSGAFIYTANGTLGHVQVLRDDSGRGDRGSRWRVAASVPGMYWATLWAPPGAASCDVYLMGVSYGTRRDMSIGRSIVIARSTNYGSSFSEPVVLFPGALGHGYSGAPTPNLIGSDGRIYRAFEASAGEKLIVMTKVPFKPGVVDLLDPDAWEMVGKPLRWNATQFLPDSFVCPVTARHPKPQGKRCFDSIQEGSAVEVNGTIYDVLRLDGQNNVTHSKAIVLKLVMDKKSKKLSSMEFVKAIEFPSTDSKFTIRQEPSTISVASSATDATAGAAVVPPGRAKYFAITNQVTPLAVNYANQNGVTGGNMALGLGVDAVGARNVLVFASSTDAVNGEWVVCDTLLYDDSGLEYVDSVRLTGFQYVDWVFDGADILYAVRASYRGSNTYHNANRLAVKRIRNYTTMCAWREPWQAVGTGWCRPSANYTAHPTQLSDRACAALCAEAGPRSCKGWANGASGCVLYPVAPTSSEGQAVGASDPAFKCHRLQEVTT